MLWQQHCCCKDRHNCYCIRGHLNNTWHSSKSRKSVTWNFLLFRTLILMFLKFFMFLFKTAMVFNLSQVAEPLEHYLMMIWRTLNAQNLEHFREHPESGLKYTDVYMAHFKVNFFFQHIFFQNVRNYLSRKQKRFK